MSMQVWCELAWLGGPIATPGVLLQVEGDRIASVRTGVAVPPAGSEVLTGLTLAGMANAHSHCFHRVLRGRTQVGEGSFWTWRQQMYAAAARLTPALYHQLAIAVFAEMVMAGYTTVGEFHYVHHQPDGSPYAQAHEMELALVDAAQVAGIRLTLLDTCYLHGGIGQPLGASQLRFADASVQAWEARVSGLVDAVGSHPQVHVGAAIHSIRAVTAAEAAVVVAWASLRRVPLHAHVSEQPLENEQCMDAYGVSPTSVLEAAGALRSAGGFCAVHATHLCGDDLRAYGSSSAYVCLCPTTERDLADGIGPSVALRAAGVRLCIGSDSHAVLDPFEELRAVELNERLSSGVRGNHGAALLLEAGAVSGMAALGWPDGGRLVEGALADLVCVRLDGVQLAGAAPSHVLESVLYAGGPRDVDSVMVGGRFVVLHGVHQAVGDVAARLRQSISALVDNE